MFAAGVALRFIERRASGQAPPSDVVAVAAADQKQEVATDPEKAPAYMAQAVLGFTEQLERIGEVAVVLLLGGMLTGRTLPSDALWFVPVLLLVIRPLSVLIGLAGSRTPQVQRSLIAWFGIRGIGSVYYVSYAIEHGLSEDLAHRLMGLTLATVTVSIMVHGISVTPLMHRYSRSIGQG